MFILKPIPVVANVAFPTQPLLGSFGSPWKNVLGPPNDDRRTQLIEPWTFEFSPDSRNIFDKQQPSWASPLLIHRKAHTSTHTQSLSVSLSLYIYIYMYREVYRIRYGSLRWSIASVANGCTSNSWTPWPSPRTDDGLIGFRGRMGRPLKRPETSPKGELIRSLAKRPGIVVFMERGQGGYNSCAQR